MLWERVAPDDPAVCYWAWTDARLERLRALHIRPIVGLIHHGSGPKYTDLLDDGFPQKLAAFAAAASARYAWVEDWTPVNEPLTTARFSALYGHWYPHLRDERAFWQALLNQIDGVRLSMRAIRRVNPVARLIQTEDLGRSWSTAPLRHQAGFDNVRRWMSWDLLCGRVVPEHPMWERLVGYGFRARLAAIADDPCPPDVIGVNHYLTSDRFLDHRMRRYPARTLGGNAEQRYADIEAIRVLDPAPPGLRGVLREAWERYRIPLAVTEVHNGCSRDEQMRWLSEAWQTAGSLRDEGIDIRAVTGWALLGSHGWNTLLTAPGKYEPGAFDTSSDPPRPTALATMMPNIARPARQHPVTRGAAWWRRPIRLLYQPVARPAPMEDSPRARDWQDAAVAPLMIVGIGRVAQAFADACAHRDIAHVQLDRPSQALATALDVDRPWAVVDLTMGICHDSLEDPAVDIARLCAERDVPMATFPEEMARDETNRFSTASAPHGGPLPDLCDAFLDSLIDGATEIAQGNSSVRIAVFDTKA